MVSSWWFIQWTVQGWWAMRPRFEHCNDENRDSLKKKNNWSTLVGKWDAFGYVMICPQMAISTIVIIKWRHGAPTIQCRIFRDTRWLRFLGCEVLSYHPPTSIDHAKMEVSTKTWIFSGHVNLLESMISSNRTGDNSFIKWLQCCTLDARASPVDVSGRFVQEGSADSRQQDFIAYISGIRLDDWRERCMQFSSNNIYMASIEKSAPENLNGFSLWFH